MANLSQVKKTIEANLSKKLNPLDGVAVNSTAIFGFISSLVGESGLNTDAVTMTAPDRDSLQLAIAAPLLYELAGGSGTLALTSTVMTLKQTDSDAFSALLETEGSFRFGNGDRKLAVQGSLADPELGILTLSARADEMPQLTELASELGIGSLIESFKSVGLSLPVLNQIDLGFELQSQTITNVTSIGSVVFGSGMLDLSCRLMPEVVIEGGIQDGSQITVADLLMALPLDSAELPSSQLQTLNLVLHPGANTSSATFTLANDWDIDIGGNTLALTKISGQIDSAVEETAAQFTGAVNLAGTQIVLSSHYRSNEPISFEGTTVPGQIVSLRRLVDSLMGGLVNLPAEVPDLAITGLTLSLTPKTGIFSVKAEAMEPWVIPVGFDDLQLDDITLQINRTLDGEGKKALSGVLGGTLEIAGAAIRSDYTFPGEFVLSGQVPSLKLSPVVQDLCGSSTLQTLPIPASVLAVDFSDVAITVAPKSQFFSLKANSSMGLVELMVKKIGNDWGFVTGFLPPASWKFSSIARELSVLDGLSFADTALVLSSVEDRSLALTSLSTLSSELSVIRGLNFVANLDMRGLGVDALLGIENLRVYTAIGGNPADIVLEAQIDGQFQLSDTVGFGDIRFRLQPSPSNFSLALLGTVTAILDNSALAFVGAMQVQPRSAGLQASMLGIWNEPFDTKGVAIANVALDLSMSFLPPLPNVGIAGTLQVGDFHGLVAVKFDSAMPSRSMLAVAFNRLYLIDVIRTFCGAAIARAIPAGLANTVLNLGFEDVNIYIAPQPTTIGELVFEQGFYLAGTLIFWGLRAQASLSIDYLEGTELKAEMDPIDVGGIFKITGAAGRPKPSVYFKLSPNPTATPQLDLSGAVELLGLRSEVLMNFSDSGFHFLSSGKIFNLFEATLEVKGQDLKSGGSIWVKASMQNDLLSYLREEATAAIQAAASKATKDLSDAQAAVANAQREVDKLNNDIANMRQTIQRERDRDSQRMRDAQAAVANAQREVAKLNNDIANMRQTIQRERDRDSQRMRDAQAAVQKAQNDVNSMQREIDSSKRRIDQLNRDIKDKENWFNRSKWYEKSYRWAEFSAYAAAKGSEIAAIYTKIGGLETAKATANGVLEGAKQVVRALERTIDSFPIDADVRIAGLFTARETANGVLEGGKQVIRGLEMTIDSFPIDADVRIAGLFTARETATAALFVATQFLEGLKISIGAMADVGQFIVEVGLGGLIDVKSAQFEGSLAATQSGSVTMAIELVFMQRQSQSLSLSFSFSSPKQAALDLAKQLLP